MIPLGTWPGRAARSRLSMKWIAIGLLAAAPALAEAPGSSIHFGVGAYWTIPVDSYGSASNYYRGSAWIPTRQDRALSLDLSYEFHNAFVALDVAFGGFSAGLPWFRMFSVRGGYVFGSGPIAPYLSAGLGYLTQDDGRWCNPFYDNCSDVSGAAVLAERECSSSAIWRIDRKSTRLNSSHSQISYAVFCLKKKK